MKNRAAPLLGVRAVAGALLAVLALSACGAKHPKHPEELRIVVENFLAKMELKNYDAALGAIDPIRRVEFLQYVDQLGERVTIAESEIRSLEVPEEDDLPKGQPLTATVLVSFKIARPPSTVIKIEHHTQKWTFSSKDKRWYLTEGW